MRIKASKGDLETALRVAEIGIAGSGADLSTHYLFRVRKAGVEVLSFNQRICAAVPLKCEHEGEDGDAFTVEGRRLNRWLLGVGDVAVEMSTSDGGDISMTSPRSTIEIPSLDPDKFPYWDKTFKEAKSVTTIPGERMALALNYAKNFTSDNDTTRPEISQVEAMGGSLWATDKKAVTLISVDGFDGSALRIHAKDIPAVTKFLSLKETESVEILEHDKAVFFCRADGASLGASRPVAQFPTLKVDKGDKDAINWTVNTEDLLAGIQCLTAAADWDNTRLNMSFKDGKIVLAVKTVSGKENSYPIDCIEESNADDLPDGGFWLDYPYIQNIIGHFPGDTIKFGINQRGKGGYVRFRHASGEDDFLTVVVWRI